MTQDEALQELLLLRQQMTELRSGLPADSLALVQFTTSHLGVNVPREMSLPELSEAFELSENLVSVRLFVIIIAMTCFNLFIIFGIVYH